jgi:hypothetical protein
MRHFAGTESVFGFFKTITARMLGSAVRIYIRSNCGRAKDERMHHAHTYTHQQQYKAGIVFVSASVYVRVRISFPAVKLIQTAQIAEITFVRTH